MKEQINTIHKSFLKKLIIKIIRKLGFEIVDQQNYVLISNDKRLDKTHSIPGKRSLVIPFGTLKITKKISDLKIIFRSCTATNIMDQNKQRIFGCQKNDVEVLTFSILKSIKKAKNIFTKTQFSISVTDGGSSEEDLLIIKKILNLYPDINSEIIIVNNENFKDKIIYIPVEDMPYDKDIYQSKEFALNSNYDLIYFVEDDYVHKEIAIEEMLLSYEKFYTILEDDLFLLPADYPYLYAKNDNTNILYGENRHWRDFYCSEVSSCK